MRVQGQLFATLLVLCSSAIALAEGRSRDAAGARCIVELDRPSLVAAASSEPDAFPRLPGGRFDFDAEENAAYLQQLEEAHGDFEAALALAFPEARVERFLSVLFDGAVVSGAGASEIEAIAGVVRAMPADSVRVAPASGDPLDAIDVEVLWDEAGGVGGAGEGVRIAIVDSGIDAANPLLDPEGLVMPHGFPRGELAFVSEKVIAARSYFRPGDPVDLSIDSADAADRSGHGSACAGVAAGRTGVAFDLEGTMLEVGGVAPRARLMSYKVFYAAASGETRASDAELMAALEDAVLDGADVISCAFGGPPPLISGTPAEIAFRAVAGAGVLAVFAAGNGGDGLGTIAFPGALDTGLTVGAFSTGRAFAGVAALDGAEAIPTALREIPAVRGAISPRFQGAPIGPSPLVSARSVGEGGDALACEPFPAGVLDGAVAFVERGGCTFSSKVENAAAAGALAVVVYNDQPGAPAMTMGGDPVEIPAVQVGNPSGVMIEELLEHETGVVISLVDTLAPYLRDGEAWTVPSFSARGPTDAPLLKPEIAAPGVAIASAYACPVGAEDCPNWSLHEGTSMAAAFAAGAAAVLRGVHSSENPDGAASILVSTASAELAEGGGAAVLDRGAGHMRFADAQAPLLYAVPPVISFGEAHAGESLEASVEIRSSVASGALVLEWAFDDEGFTPQTSPESGATVEIGDAVDLELEIPFATPGGERTGRVSLEVGQGPGARALEIPFHYRVVPPVRRDLLLLDLSFLDAHQEGLLQVYRELADGANLDYDVFRVDDSNGAPGLAALQGYDAVVAFTGNDQTAYSGGLGTRALDVLSTFLARGGRLIVAGQGPLRGSEHARLFGTLGARTAGTYPFFDPFTLEVAELDDYAVRISQDLFPAGAAIEGAAVDIAPDNGGSGELEFAGEVEEVLGPGLPTSLTRPVLFMDDPVFDGGVGALGAVFDPYIAYGDFPDVESLKQRAVLLGFGLERVGDSGSLLDSLALFELLHDWVVASIDVDIEVETVDLHVIVDAETSGDALLEYTFDFGDGSEPVATDAGRIYWEYAEPGEYEITVLARSALGAADVARVSVEVPSEEPPSTDSDTAEGGGSGWPAQALPDRGPRDCGCLAVGRAAGGEGESLLAILTRFCSTL